MRRDHLTYSIVYFYGPGHLLLGNFGLLQSGYSVGAKVSVNKDFRVCRAHFSEDDYITKTNMKEGNNYFEECCFTSTPGADIQSARVKQSARDVFRKSANVIKLHENCS